MSFSLLDTASVLISNDLVIKANAFVDETEGSVSRAFEVILSAVIVGMAEKAATVDGANAIKRLSFSAYNSGYSVNSRSFFGNNNGGSLLNNGARILTALFGEKYVGQLKAETCSYSGIRPSSAESLLSMATPVLLDLLGKHILFEHLNTEEISVLLKNEKDRIKDKMPVGLQLSKVFKGLNKAVDDEAVYGVEEVDYDSFQLGEKKAAAGIQTLLILLIMVLVAMATWYFLGKNFRANHLAIAAETYTLQPRIALVNSIDPNATINSAAGRLDTASGNFFYHQGSPVTINLPDLAQQLEVGELSTENKLYRFLIDRDGELDTVKGNWFELTDVHFKRGSSQVDSSSIQQLNNIAKIIRAFPTAEFKIGGYTDNSGDSSTNVVLSQQRAEVIMTQLKKMGVSPSAITGAKGYGPQWPLTSNATPLGRAMNRRVAVNVKAR